MRSLSMSKISPDDYINKYNYIFILNFCSRFTGCATEYAVVTWQYQLEFLDNISHGRMLNENEVLMKRT